MNEVPCMITDVKIHWSQISDRPWVESVSGNKLGYTVSIFKSTRRQVR